MKERNYDIWGNPFNIIPDIPKPKPFHIGEIVKPDRGFKYYYPDVKECTVIECEEDRLYESGWKIKVKEFPEHYYDSQWFFKIKM